MDPTFDIEVFIKDHGEDVINMFGITEEEQELLKDKFVAEIKVDQSTLPENDRKSCVICLGEFEINDQVLIHPECKHTFHLECAQEWFKTKLICPLCKLKTRPSMLRSICKENSNKFADRDYVLETAVDAPEPQEGFLEGMVSKFMSSELDHEIKNERKTQNSKKRSTNLSDPSKKNLNVPLINNDQNGENSNENSGLNNIHHYSRSVEF